MISFHDLTTNLHLKRKRELKKWLKEIIERNEKAVGEINIIFCNDEYLLDMNRKHLNHDYYTDIITFDYTEDVKSITGDIYISIDRVTDNATQFKVSVENELHRVMAHGILHLLGYNDETAGEKEEIKKQEDACLDLL